MAGQDVRIVLKPGESRSMQIRGEFLYLKSAPNPVTVTIEGRSVEMIQGDKHRSDKQFSEFQVVNNSDKHPAPVVFVVGYGDYTTQVIQGEIMVEPGLRRSDGSFVPDTRHEIKIDLLPLNPIVRAYKQGDLVLSSAEIETPTQNGKDVVGWTYSNQDKVFPGPNGTIAISWRGRSASGTNPAGGTKLFDRNLKLIQHLDIPAKYANSGISGMAYSYTLGYVQLATGNRLVQAKPGSQTLLAKITGAPSDSYATLVYIPWRDTFISTGYNGGNLIEYTIEAGEIRIIRAGILPTMINTLALDETTRQLVATGAWGGVRAYDYATLEEVWRKEAVGFHAYTGHVIAGRYWYVESRPTNSAHPVQLQKRVIEDFETLPEITARVPGCEAVHALLKTEQAAILPTAGISVEVLADQFRVHGEVIKAALEYYYQTSVSDDYLDHVFAVDLGRDGTGRRFKRIHSGNRSFARAEIDDNFTMLVPGQVTITIDNDLKLGPPELVEI